ncbi:origin recognition complex subunit 3-like [Gigantopelta aegis]|uniref:origin recognition complex subunit 3-like n=1 Tax=Gigantopelta aegis TaxID=1735272 RepID=UPI001B887D8D|nr:origin recognition complex subunit 3-like [Gigantopelta aegis]
MDTAESVSRGCFAYKGKKKVARKEDYFPKKDGAGKVRLLACQNMWDRIDTKINDLQSCMNSKIFDELLKFAQSSHGSHKTVVGTSAIHEIPTAALITGVNTPDHAVMFTNLVLLLKEKVTPLVSTLRSKDCPNLKSAITKMISHFTSNPNLMLDEDDAEIVPRKRNYPTTMTSLVTWYKKKCIMKVNEVSPKKRKVKTGEAAADVTSQPPLVVVLEDMESFAPQMLQDFIVICSNYLHDLPFVLVFGIATAVTVVHRLLPNAVSSLLCMEKFQAPPSTDYLTLVINKVLMTPDYPFKLGAKVFQLLLDVFLYHDFSVVNFVKSLHFCVLDHYMRDSLSQLCRPETDLHDTVSQLTHAQLERLRQTPSLMTYVESCPANKIGKLLEDDKYLKKEAVDLFSKLHKYHRIFFPMLRCLHVLVANLPKHPLGKQLRELYAVALESDVADSEGYRESVELLGFMSQDELSRMLAQCIEILQDSSEPSLENVKKCLLDLKNKLENLDELEDPQDESQITDELIPKKTDLHNLRKSLQQMKKNKKQTPYERVRSDILQCFTEVFREHLKCPKSQTFYEIFYYNSVSTVKQHIYASPRSAIQTALGNPCHYLQCKCCEGSTLSSTMPDICVAYKLHLECGQLVNLYDWLNAFTSVVTSDKENQTEDPNSSSILQARFIRAVSELQFLGFIKPTKRKTDHVARLTWGCV